MNCEICPARKDIQTVKWCGRLINLCIYCRRIIDRKAREEKEVTDAEKQRRYEEKVSVDTFTREDETLSEIDRHFAQHIPPHSESSHESSK